MQKIIPHLWFDHQAEEAAHFYCSLFEHAGVSYIARMSPPERKFRECPKGPY